ncbi:hypothetical protein O3G_MSEX015305 [Manduca sexta]|uniref:Uncharacterized protein n=2 Tax=Manduca sexta TaxID=7130 RepID=A0A921ZWP3_MANSE|nr:hypothetical protein O3G_MSEX015305 [Manduca sexta]
MLPTKLMIMISFVYQILKVPRLMPMVIENKRYIDNSRQDMAFSYITEKMVKNSKKTGSKKKGPPSYANVLHFTHSDIMVELQSKYPGLHDLSKKTKHQLLDNISKTIVERLKKIMETNYEASEKCFLLSRHYRRVHPHFGDFQFVLDALHRIQDAAGSPREQLAEQDISAVNIKASVIDNIPFDKVKQACNKYCDRIANKVTEHIGNLNMDVQEGDTEEEIVRKKVRGELKKLGPFVPTIIRQVVMKNFIPEQSKSHPIHVSLI